MGRQTMQLHSPALLLFFVFCCSCNVWAASAPLPLGDYCGVTHAIPNLPPGLKLKQVHVFIRHGDRIRASPGTCWPHDDVVYNCSLTQVESTEVGRDMSTMPPTELVYRLQNQAGDEVLPGNCGLGQLTAKGYSQHIANGQQLAKAYVGGAGLLPNAISQGDLSSFRLRSDDSRRTIMSGQALVSGMFPNGAVVPPGSSGSPLVPTWNIRDKYYEDIVPNSYACPNLDAASAAAANSPEMLAFQKRAEGQLATISKALGQKYDFTVGSFVGLFDCLYTHACHDYPLPPQVTPEIFSTVVNISTEYIDILFNYNASEYSKIGTAKLLEEMFEAMEGVRDGHDVPKFLLYSGHDLGPIAPMLSAYGVFDSVWPAYASLIAVELYSTGAAPADLAVRMVYNGKVLHPPGCADSLCTWGEFEDITTKIISYGAECKTGAGDGASAHYPLFF